MSITFLVFATLSGVLGPQPIMANDVPYAGHGIAGERVLLFQNEMQPLDSLLESRVAVYDSTKLEFLGSQCLGQFSGGKLVGELPPPPNGWNYPMAIHVTSFDDKVGFPRSGEVMVFDSTYPMLMPPVPVQRFVRYQYTYTPNNFSSQIVEIIPLPYLTSGPGQLPNGTILVSNFVVLNDGTIIVADPIVGSVWYYTSGSGWTMGLLHPAIGASQLSNICGYDEGGNPIYGLCGTARGEDCVLEEYLMAVIGGIAPGSFGITYVGLTDKVVLNNAATGGIFQITLSNLKNQTVPPYMKELETLVAPVPGVNDLAGSVTWDRFNPQSEWVYWQRIVSPFEIYRVNVLTGVVEFVTESLYFYDHPSMMSVIPAPAFLGGTWITSSNTQERNMVDTNPFITESTLVSPSIGTIVVVY